MYRKFLRMSKLTLDSYFHYYSRTDKSPNLINAARLIPYFLVKRFKGYGSLIRFIKSASYGSEHVSVENIVPSIELLFVSTRKDSETLVLAIRYAIKHSLNHISKIVVIVPDSQVTYFSDLLNEESPSNLVEVRSEDTQINESDRNRIRNVMGNRYGWTLQQFLTVSYCLSSKSEGVLAINSDTIILRDQLWLNSLGQQILMESYEFNSDYYKIIEKINSQFVSLSRSHITHHMLFQPSLLWECLAYFKVSDLSEFIELFMSSVNPLTESPLCAEFEPYAQFLRKSKQDRVEMVKFGNLGLERSRHSSLDEVVDKYEKAGNYNSISFHSWMG
jgi:hypothetical protein